MTKFLAVISFTFLISASVFASEFEGSWSGDGYVMSLEEREPAAATFQITVSFSDELLSLEQCVLPKSGASSQECSSATYKVVNDVVYNQFDEKIGDIFPGKIFILESNAQVSEQVQLALNGSGELRFNYYYVNLDGESITKKAYLQKD